MTAALHSLELNTINQYNNRGKSDITEITLTDRLLSSSYDVRFSFYALLETIHPVTNGSYINSFLQSSAAISLTLNLTAVRF